MLRALEILIGIVLGCMGLLLSRVAVARAVALSQTTLAGGDISAADFLGIGLLTLVASLIFLAAWKLLRPGVTRRWARWVGVASTGATLVLFVIATAIAIPSFLRFSKASDLSEPMNVLSAIRTAEEAYFSEFGEYIAFDSVPSGPPGRTLVNRIEYPEGAEAIGWSFEQVRPVWCRYSVAVGSATESGQAQAFTAEAICDTDGDGVLMAWGYVRPDRGSGEAIPGPFGRCPTEGAIDRSTGQHSVTVVGPCDEKSGSEVF
jgi:hypothetical protein